MNNFICKEILAKTKEVVKSKNPRVKEMPSGGFIILNESTDELAVINHERETILHNVPKTQVKEFIGICILSREGNKKTKFEITSSDVDEYYNKIYSALIQEFPL